MVERAVGNHRRRTCHEKSLTWRESQLAGAVAATGIHSESDAEEATHALQISAEILRCGSSV